jgi:hypothetical protein
MPNSYGAFKSHFGEAIETVYGTTVGTPTVWVPVSSWDDLSEDQGLVMDETKRGKAALLYGVYSGMAQGSWGITGPYFHNPSARFWARLLGTDTIGSSSNGGWQHNFTLADLPLSATAFVWTGSTVAERQWVGSQYSDLTFKFSRASGMASIKVAAKSFAPSTGITETTPVYTTDPAARGWQAVFSIGGSTKTTLLDYEISFKRPVDLIFAANNSQKPAAVEVGPLDVSGKLRLYGSTEGPYTNYRANTQQSIDIQLSELTAGSTQNALEILMSKAVFSNVKPDLGGNYLIWDTDFRAIYNSTAGGDSGPAQVFATISTSSGLGS